jgi:stage IV sporulation protein FA
MVREMNYESVEKYMMRNKNDNGGMKKVNHFLFLVIIILVALIYLKTDGNTKNKISNLLSVNNISFAKINKWYKNNLGNILPFKNEEVKEVFEEKIEYSKLEEYKNGVKLTTKDKYLVPNLNDGMIIFIGKKDDFGNTIVIQSSNEVEYWYSNLDNIDHNLYDYVNKGEYLGEVKNKTLYLNFYKKGEALDYKEYLQ